MKNTPNKYKFQIILSFIFLIAITSFVGHIIQVGFVEFFNEFGTKDKPFYLVNIAIALAAIATAIFTWWRNSINQKQTEINQKQTEIQFAQLNKIQTQIDIQSDTRLDSLFSQAVEFIKSDNDLITRKGGVHILKDLALSSPKHAQKCLDMLCSLNESWMPSILDENPDFFDMNRDFININNFKKILHNKLPDNIVKEKLYEEMYLSQLVLKSLSDIIKKISYNPEYNDIYSFSNKYLCSIDLNGVIFDNKFIFENTNLQSAKFCYANLHSTNLFRADLKFTELFQTKLQSAYLSEAKLQSADLRGAKLQSADLSSADLQSSDLEYTDFSKAKLYATDFRNAYNIDKAIFDDNKNSAIFNDEDYRKHFNEDNSE